MRSLGYVSRSRSWGDAHVKAQRFRAGVAVAGIALERKFDGGQAVALSFFPGCGAAPLMCRAGTR